jgi:hypothetical protein
MNQYRINFEELRVNALQKTAVNDISANISSSTTINAAPSNASLVKGTFNVGSMITGIYNYNIDTWVNFVSFDVIVNQGSAGFTFNVYDPSTNLLFTKYIGNTLSWHVKLLLIKGVTGWTVFNIGLDPDTITGEIATLNSQVSVIQTNELTFGVPTDLGDKDKYDFTISDFLLNNKLNHVDLSPFIPLTAKFVLCRVEIYNNTGTGSICFLEYGNTYLINSSTISIESTGGHSWQDIWIATNIDRKLAYKGFGIVNILNVSVAGWM